MGCVMRVATYCPPRFRSLVEPAIGVPAEVHERWPDFERAVGGADCAVALIEWLNEVPGATELRRLRKARPQQGFVLVTRFSRENAALLPDTADRFVWLAEIEERLNSAVSGATHGLCARLERFIRTGLSPRGRTGLIRLALLALLDADPPVRTVKEWSALVPVSCSVSTLQKRFAGAFESGITPLFVLEAVRLYRALDEFPDVRSWTQLAVKAGSRWYEDGRLSPKTFSDTAARLLGKIRIPKEIRRDNGAGTWDPPPVERPCDLRWNDPLGGLVLLLR